MPQTKLRLESLETRELLASDALGNPLPNDPRFAEQWSLVNSGQSGGTPNADIAVVEAWRYSTGSTRTPVALIDSGIDYTHPDLARNIWINQKEIPASRRANLRDFDNDGVITFRDLNHGGNIGPGKITDLNRNGIIDAGDILQPMIKDSRGRDTGRGGWADGLSQDGETRYIDDLVGWNFVTNTNKPLDDLGHGTHIAGIIAAESGNKIGVAGIASRTPLAAIKIFDENGLSDSDRNAAAINYAVAKGFKIINASWSETTASPQLRNALVNAQNKGVIVVTAAGNDSANTDRKALSYPAGFHLRACEFNGQTPCLIPENTGDYLVRRLD
jgi:subtilisin family serine protease